LFLQQQKEEQMNACSQLSNKAYGNVSSGYALFFTTNRSIVHCMKANTGCNRIRCTALKIYCDQTNINITTQFLTEHFLTLQVSFYKCSLLLSLVMRQTSRRYSNSTYSLPKKVTCTRAMALTILSRSSWRSTGMGGMYTLSFTNPQNEKSMCVRLGDLGGHGMQQPRPIHLPVNFDNLEWFLWSPD
jgi:hypothetical protein